ncbi:3'-phosphoesterase [Candidatus Babeliales bacterium]|nr:3'-phosphoesterase [Candidatus Babeliales bacterium]
MPGRKFVIHKHDATNLHYDFRLSIGNVLKSWAIPKGPSLNPKHKRLAIETEDHSLQYGSFEGVIPEGKYGAGTVMLWDKGTYKNIKKENGKTVSLKKCLKNGLLEIWLNGEKLKGGFALIKMKSRKKQWLLVKMKDEEANARKNIIKSEPKSVKTGKTMAQIKKTKN